MTRNTDHIDVPPNEGKTFENMMDFTDATTPLSHQEDEYRPLVKIGDQTYKIRRVRWDSESKTTYIET